MNDWTKNQIDMFNEMNESSLKYYAEKDKFVEKYENDLDGIQLINVITETSVIGAASELELLKGSIDLADSDKKQEVMKIIEGRINDHLNELWELGEIVLNINLEIVDVNSRSRH